MTWLFWVTIFKLFGSLLVAFNDNLLSSLWSPLAISFLFSSLNYFSLFLLSLFVNVNYCVLTD